MVPYQFVEQSRLETWHRSIDRSCATCPVGSARPEMSFFELIYIFCDNSNSASVIQQPCIGCAKKSRKFVVVVSRWEIATVKTMTIITRKVQFTSCWSNSDFNACEGERDRFKMDSLPACLPLLQQPLISTGSYKRSGIFKRLFMRSDVIRFNYNIISHISFQGSFQLLVKTNGSSNIFFNDHVAPRSSNYIF